ncbi:MAG TPA: hypothetical protein PKX40_17535 [Spirochaetota bacterium]|nr:hypothetical protein [Spirochaetota bacterium]
MKSRIAAIILSSMVILPGAGYSFKPAPEFVDVRVYTDNGGEMPRYRAYPRTCQTGSYYYMEAVKGERYSIEVTNRSGQRIAVVVAVDGRNIISGARSYLKNSERMYIIEPYSSGSFNGWRTAMDRTNRFYFTEPSDSYAERVFADASAMGTIAVAVYREKQHAVTPIRPPYGDDYRSGARGESKKSSSEMQRSESADREAGTGFGETTYSPAREVAFEPESTMAGRIVLKYEWRQELCRKGIASCERPNRFWPVSDGFAPVPRDFRD